MMAYKKEIVSEVILESTSSYSPHDIILTLDLWSLHNEITLKKCNKPKSPLCIY